MADYASVTEEENRKSESMKPKDAAEASEDTRWLFAQECTFVAGADRVEILPPPGLPEIAFAGRSNVGKSSLLNALLGRKKLARISQHPGRTQQLNFFILAQKFYLVDMPGYGYAEASKTKIKAWTQLIHNYLKGRASLKRVFLLIDSRHGFKPQDKLVMEELDKDAVSYQIVLTKCDKTDSAKLEKLEKSIITSLKKHPAAFPAPILTSSVKKKGIDELRETIVALL